VLDVGKPARTLTLLLPGLLGDLPGMDQPGFPEPRAGALAELLARGRRRSGPAEAPETLLCRLLGVAPDENGDLPVAALTWLGDSGEADGGWWLRADPVHLRADQSRLILFDSYGLGIEPAEAEALVERFNGLYADEGWRLHAPVPERWYLRLAAPPGIRTTPLEAVIGRHIDPWLPTGPEARQWHRILNEVQMLFHDHPVNGEREARGRPAINSVWFWGGGALPGAPHPDPLPMVWTDEPLGKGLATLAGACRADRPADGREWLSQAGSGGHVAVIEDLHGPALYGDLEAWAQGVEALETTWFTPLVQAVKQGMLQTVTLFPGNGQSWHLDRGALRRFWRRPRGLGAWG